MKILIVNTSERTGGAAVAASRLFKALKKQGVTVSMLVRDKQSRNEHVISLNNTILNRFRFIWERLVIFVCNLFSKNNLFQISIANTGINIVNHELVKQADIIHLHWINQGMLSLNDIKWLINSGKPVVWTLHDMWPSTAICHYSGICKQYETKCKSCPKLAEIHLWNLERMIFNRKKRIGLQYINFVGCSNWITNVCRASSLLSASSFTSIPNPIDTNVFKPKDKILLREKKSLPKDKFLLLFAAAKLSDERKGLSYLIEACNILESKGYDLEILLMGTISNDFQKLFPFKVRTLGYLSLENDISDIYSLSDIFVTPSLEDNLPNTIMESMACGTPCVGFEIGGIPEMIDHKKNGYVAKYKSAEDLAEGIRWILDNPDREGISTACVDKVNSCYSEDIVAQKYIALYERLLAGKR